MATRVQVQGTQLTIHKDCAVKISSLDAAGCVRALESADQSPTLHISLAIAIGAGLGGMLLFIILIVVVIVIVKCRKTRMIL